MKKIALIHPGLAYAPEIGIYKHFLKQEGYFVETFNVAMESELTGFDVEWHFMGIDFKSRRSERLKIHEYVSLSIPPFSKMKDQLKKFINSKPDLRIFGSKFIESQLGFKDAIPRCYRDAGVSPDFFQKPQKNKPEFDFVYAGSTDKSRNIEHLLTFFVENMQNNRLLVIGVPPKSVSKRVLQHPAITFTGKVPYETVPDYLQKARFGINYIPDKYPYNQQRPLKLLEYCAAGLPVLTTEYAWVKQFEKEANANFFKLAPDLGNLKMNNVEGFEFRIPDVTHLTWNEVISQSGLLTFLKLNL